MFQLIPLKKLSMQAGFLIVDAYVFMGLCYLFSYWLDLGFIIWGLLFLQFLLFLAHNSIGAILIVVAAVCLAFAFICSKSYSFILFASR